MSQIENTSDTVTVQSVNPVDSEKRYFQSCLPQYFLDHLTKEFYNLAVRQRDGLDVFLETYISLWPTDGLVMFDIGAGCYASGSDSDTTLAIKFAKHFGCAKNRFFAFEPQPDVFMKTMQCLNKELFPDRFCVALENAAFSNVTSRLQLAGKANVASLTEHLAKSGKKHRAKDRAYGKKRSDGLGCGHLCSLA